MGRRRGDVDRLAAAVVLLVKVGSDVGHLKRFILMRNPDGILLSIN
jgi:hypothetical protein